MNQDMPITGSNNVQSNPGPSCSLGQGVLIFLHRLLESQTLAVGTEDFEETARMVIEAKRQLTDAISGESDIKS